MNRESVRLCPEAFFRLLREKSLSHGQVAQQLGVSTKTIQRWINGTTKTIRIDDLNKLCQILGTQPKTLILSEVVLRNKPTNFLLEEITSDDYLQKVHATGDWRNYAKMLVQFKNEKLSSQQELYLNEALGTTYLYLGMLRAAKYHLQKSHVLAEALGDNSSLITTKCSLAMCSEVDGSFATAFELIKQAQHLLLSSPDANSNTTQAVFHLTYGRLLSNTDQHAEAETHLRKALLLCHDDLRHNITRIAVGHLYLGFLYLRSKNLSKAGVSFLRLIRFSTVGGWNRGKAIGYSALAVIHLLQGQDPEAVVPYFGKARTFRQIYDSLPLQTKLEQLEFVAAIIKKDYLKAKEVNQNRQQMVRRGRLPSALLILDELFLEKLMNSQEKISERKIKDAEALFQKNNLTPCLKAVDFLRSTPSIDTNNFLELYPFL